MRGDSGRDGRHRGDRLRGGQGTPGQEFGGQPQWIRTDRDAPTGSRDRTDDIGAANCNIDTDVCAPFRREHRYDGYDTRELHAGKLDSGKLHTSQHGARDHARHPKHYSRNDTSDDPKHHSGNDTTYDNDHHQTTDNHHDPARRDLRRHFAMMDRVESAFGERTFRAIGTTATVVVLDPAKAETAEAILRDEINSIDLACSRFRPDSELAYLHSQSGRTTVVSPLLFGALTVAIAVAEKTHGAVDPTVGNAMSALGYDRDFDHIGAISPRVTDALGPIVGFRHVHLDTRTRSVRIPRGVRLDLGSSAKAWAADRAALRLADQLGTGVLVSIGGDVAVAGAAPTGGWPIGIAVDSSAPAHEVDQVVAIHHGGLASSSTAVRAWMVGDEKVHHIVDPMTSSSAAPHWTLVSATGSSCVDANALSTAAIVWEGEAIRRLRAFDQAVRLVRYDGMVITLGGWPEG